MFGANVFGVMQMCQVFLPELLAVKGTIINMGSIAGHLPIPFMSAYAASKAAVHAYSGSLRVELAPLGVKVIYVMTGNVKTNTVNQRNIIWRKRAFGTPSRINSTWNKRRRLPPA